jgi:phytoene synthase
MLLFASSNTGKITMASDESTLAPGLRLLPPDIRADVHLLYDVLRTLDDLVDDDQPEAPNRVEAVERWARDEPSDTHETCILTELSRRHALPRQAFLDFCQGMRHDIARATIHTEEDLERYCQQAGGSVGIMLAHILGSVGPEAETKMATLGRAMQRTNILRDIDEDATHGRVYVAHSTIERFGAPTPGQRTELLRDQIARADDLYDQVGDATLLPNSGHCGMALCTSLYREILRQIERNGYGRTAGRVVVPTWRRRLLIAEHRLRSHDNQLKPAFAQP